MSNQFDLSQTKAASQQEDEGQWIELANEVGEPYDPTVRFLVAGTYSSHFRKIDSAQTERALKQGRKALRRDVVERNRVERAAACILKWEGVMFNGAPIECTRENAMRVLEAPWIREQVEEAMNDHSGFSRSA